MLFYITYNGYNISEASGIWKKMMSQTKVLQRSFERAYCAVRNSQTAYLIDGIRIIEKEIAITREEYFRILVHWLEKYKVSRTYVRYPFADKWFIEFLKYQKENHIKTVLEIASYPYDGELSNSRLKVEDSLYRKQVSDYIDIISTYSPGGMIWGKPRIFLANGVNVEKCKVSRKEKEEKRLTLIGVSSGMAPWMGYERLIEGLRHYYQDSGEYDIRVKFVGNLGEKEYYRSLVERYNLKKYVDFCGFLSGTELDEAYDQADIAVGSLGFYKIGASIGSPIKGAEYCARGLPAICGYIDTRFPEGTPFILKVPNDETPIDFSSVIDFYEKLSSQAGYREKIREYAIKNLTWDSIMKPVIEYLR